MELDKISLKALRKLYRAPMTEEEYKAVLGWTEKNQFNEVDSFLRKNELVKSIIIDGVKDGAGGYIDGTVVRRFEITRSGRAALEQSQSAGREGAFGHLMHFLQTIRSFLPF